jgi:hypothetical protein
VSGRGAQTLCRDVTPVHDETARPAARRLVDRLLASHAEARSLLSEASHWRGLAEDSAAVAAAAARAADTARLRYEELRHRIDPRGERRGRFGTACVLVAAVGAVLAGLAWIELAGWISAAGAPAGWLVAAAVAAVWLGGAWLAGTAGHERRGLLAGAAAALAALLTVAHGRDRFLDGVLCAVLSGALAVTAAALIARAEPAAAARARRHWRHARKHRDAAAKVAADDAERAAVTRTSWLGLVRAASAEAAAGDERLATDAIGVAAEMI